MVTRAGGERKDKISTFLINSDRKGVFSSIIGVRIVVVFLKQEVQWTRASVLETLMVS